MHPGCRWVTVEEFEGRLANHHRRLVQTELAPVPSLGSVMFF